MADVRDPPDVKTMKRAGTKIAGLGCVIVLLAGLACACGPRESPPTEDENQVNIKLIYNMIDDFFAYVKIADTKRMPTYFEDSEAAENAIHSAVDNVGEKAFEEWCNKITAQAEVTGIGSQSADLDITITTRDETAIMENATTDGAFADAGELSDAIHTAPFVTKTITVKLVKEEKWVFASAGSDDLLDTLFGFPQKDGLIAPPEESTTGKNELPISVYDAYWVDTKGQETGGYHSSDGKICLYVYTWNTYSNKEISYEYTDAAGNLLYSNSFLMKNNTDWIACSWSPSAALPAGEICCHVYDTNGDLVYISNVGIYADDDLIPFPITWLSTSHWVGADGLPVVEYLTDTTLISYEGKALKFYKDLELSYQFTDAEEQVLFEGKMVLTDSTDTFIFSFVPQVPFEQETTITLTVTTSDGTPFLTQQIRIVMPEVFETDDHGNPIAAPSATTAAKAG